MFGHASKNGPWQLFTQRGGAGSSRGGMGPVVHESGRASWPDPQRASPSARRWQPSGRQRGHNGWMRLGHSARENGQPLVTILVTSYNYGRYLAAALDSALAQTHPAVEVLVVDDGSTDDSREILNRYGDRVRTLLLENGGQAAAVNLALPLVRGHILILLDADDGLAPDVVARVVDRFRAQPECVRVQYRLQLCDGEGRMTGRTVPPAHVPLAEGDLRAWFLRHRGWRWPPTSGNAWLVSALRQLPPVPTDAFRVVVDRWWGDLIPLLGEVRALHKPGGWYRVHAESYTAGEGRGEHYFRTRVERRDLLHAAARQLASDAGLASYPAYADDLLDPALSSWLLVCRKLGIQHRRGGRFPQWCEAVRGLHASAVQPGRSVRSRMRQTLWYAALLAVPARTSLARRLVAARYDADGEP